jgi:hypothetical protein
MDDKKQISKFVIPEGVDEQYESVLRDMQDPRSKYTPEQKAQAVAAMALWGTSEKAASKLPFKIPPATIRWWKTESTWWADVEARFWREKNGELVAGYTQAIHHLNDYILELVTQGEPIYDPKTGNLKGYKKPSLRDSVMAMAIIQDKRAVLKGEPTAISSKSATEQLKELLVGFMEQSDRIRKDKPKQIIDGDYEVIDKDNGTKQ